MGLFDRIVAADVYRVIQILRALTAQKDCLTALGNNGLAQIIVEILFWIGFFGVEFANAGMGHLARPSDTSLS